MSPIHPSFAQLSWDDLDAWAGSKVVKRGRSYTSQVRDLACTKDGALLAWVDGTHRYATQVSFGESNKLTSICSCPYGSACKHAVAVILTGLDALKSKRELPLAESDDARLEKLLGDGGDDLDDEDSDEGDFGDESESDDRLGDGESAPSGSRPVSQAKSKTAKREQILRMAFEAMSKEELIAYVMDLAEQYSDVGKEIVERETLKSSSLKDIVRSLGSEIRSLTREPAWHSHWSDEGELPDYSHVRSQLEALLEAGHANEVLAVGEELWRRGNEQIGQSDDEGDTAMAIGECMGIVLRAIPRSSLKPADQLLRLIDIYMDDEYSTLDGQSDPLDEQQYGQEDWATVADRLAQRLEAMAKPDPGDDSFHGKYQRERVAHWVITALENAARKSEIIPLLEREAPITACYEALVDRLISARRKDEARRWAIEGFHKTITRWPGIAWELERRLREMAEREKDAAAVAAYRALEFFQEPSLAAWRNLQKATEAMKVWAPVRKAILNHLETGVRPETRTGAGKKPEGDQPSDEWPLPRCEISLPTERRSRSEYPDTGTLIDIALHEERHDDAIRWLETARRKRSWGMDRDDAVAKAVQDTHPDVALRVWKERADELIARVQPAAYEEAAKFMRLMRGVYERTNRVNEWKAYLATLRVQHKPKRSLMKILDSLEGKKQPPKRILDS